MEAPDDADVDDNQLQACYVLHGDSTTKGSENGRGRRAKCKGDSKPAECDPIPGFPSRVNEPPVCGQWRLQAFRTVWGRMQKLIEDIMEEQNHDIYEDMQQWICNRQYGDAQLDLCQAGTPASFVTMAADHSVHQPKATTTLRKQLHTALLFLGGIDPSDHQRTFDGLVLHLRAHKCHVARLTSLDFSSKAGIAGPLRNLFRQLIGFIPETTDMDILLAWHREAGNEGLPVVIVVENAESCDSKILSELAILLSEWIRDIPMVLIMGMATTGDAVRKLFPSNALVRLRLWRFALKSPPELLEVLMRAVMVDTFCAFEVSQQVAAFLFGFFKGHDLTVSAISRSLKVASIEHFSKEPLSLLCEKILKVNSKAELEAECAALPDELLVYAATLPSAKRFLSGQTTTRPISSRMGESLWQLRNHKKMWATAFLCLHTVAKHGGVEFADQLSQALSGFFSPPCSHDESLAAVEGKQNSEADTPLGQLMSRLRDMSVPTLKSVLEDWRKVTIHVKELNADISHLLSDFTALAKAKDSDSCCPDPNNADLAIKIMNRSKLRRMGQKQISAAERTGVLGIRKAAEDLLLRILRQHLVPPESLPFHEVFCFKDVTVLKEALIGETRRRVHLDLLHSQSVIRCQCCPADGKLSSSLHDTTLAYCLCQNHGDLIKVHSWYQSFAAVCDPKAIEGPEEEAEVKGKRRGRKKKRPRESDPPCPAADNVVENISIEARFTRAATELQIMGLLQLPKKGQSDSVRRICL